MKKVCFLFALFLGQMIGLSGAHAQSVVVKTNMMGWATLSPNLGIEMALAPQWTLDLYGSVNPFSFSKGKQWKHWLVQPEARYWLCETFHGHFFGLHLLGGEYNIGQTKLPFGVYDATHNRRFEGWGAGGGFSYGYHWIWSRHWSLEASLGIGYIFSKYKKYPCANCGKLLDSGNKHYLGVTKAIINLVYAF